MENLKKYLSPRSNVASNFNTPQIITADSYQTSDSSESNSKNNKEKNGKHSKNGKTILLTKSRYVSGLNCKKAIWMMFNTPDKMPEIDEATQHRFDEGHKVGELAKQLFPDGIEIKSIIPKENDKNSREMLKEGKPLFEAGFLHKNGICYARADVLSPTGKDNEWDIYEVKSATKVKEDYLEDVSFQKYCYESAGLKIRNCYVVHINNQYIKWGAIDAKDFFIVADVTEEVNDIIPTVDEKIEKLRKIISLPVCPEITPGDSCCLGTDAYKNFGELHENDKFFKEHPECDILDLYFAGKKAKELFNSGILTIKSIPESHKLNEKQKIQHEAHKNEKHHCNIEELSSFIKQLKYPIYFLDFESYNTAIPLYNGLKPYQQIPFQFSLHVIDQEGQKPKHFSFIAPGNGDPRKPFIEELKKVLGTEGSIIVYNESFEQTVLRKLGEFMPLHGPWINSLMERMVDLYFPFRNFFFYHPKQQGSASIKYVLPALTGKTYDDFEIANGSQASLSYLYITHGSADGKKASFDEITKVRADLERYCGQDTEGMIWILDKLKELIK